MADILIFNPNSTPVANIPIQYLTSQNTLDFVGRNDVIFNPFFSGGYTLQNTKVINGQLVLLSQNDIDLISGSLFTGQLIDLANQISGNKQTAKDLFVQTGSSFSNALYAFNSLVFQSINSLRDFMGLNTFSASQLSNAINNKIDGIPVIINDSNFSSSGNVASTGNALQVQINTINNGTGNFIYSLNGFGTTGSFDLRYLNSGSSGVFYSSLNPTQFIKSGDVSAIYATISSLSTTNTNVTNLTTNLGTTGSNLNNLIIGLSGQLDITGIKINTLTNNLSNNSTNLSGNLGLTGSNLYNYIVGLSGKLDLTGSNLQGLINTLTTNLGSNSTNLSGNLGLTGSNLYNYITSLSGKLDLSGSNLNSRCMDNSNNLSGNLALTGTNARSWIVGLSGAFDLTGSNLNNRINTLFNQNEVTGISISGGSSFTGLFSIIPGTNIILTQLGTSGVMIAGPTSAGEANTASNLGGGVGLFNQKSILDLQFNSITGGTGIAISLSGGNVISINADSVVGGSGILVVQSGDNWVINNKLNIYESGIKNTAYFRSQYGDFYPLNPALWSKQIQMHLPASTTSQTVIGNGAGTNLGTLSHVASQYYGYYTNYITTVNLPTQTAGTSFNIANLFRGNTIGRNGFLVASKFNIVDNTGTYLSGDNNPAAISTSGVRFFFGVTDQSLAITLGATNPAGNRAGFSFIQASGGAVAGRKDSNFMFSTKDNTTEELVNTTLRFNSGSYEGIIYYPPFPNTGNIFWSLRDVVNGFAVTGTTQSGKYPLANTALRAGIGIMSISGGQKNIGTQILYSEV